MLWSMNISEDVCAAAVLRIFSQAAVEKPGESLLLSSLRFAWNDVGLRLTDLSRGIDILIGEGILRPERDAEGMALALTPRGAKYLSSHHATLRNFAKEWQAWLILRRASRRSRSPLPTRNRRH